MNRLTMEEKLKYKITLKKEEIFTAEVEAASFHAANSKVETLLGQGSLNLRVAANPTISVKKIEAI